jgi:DNA-binding IclR family transcriptional regulator
MLDVPSQRARGILFASIRRKRARGATLALSARPSVTSRVLALLAAFDDHRPRLTLTELARAADLPVSTAHRLIGELEAWDAVERDADGSYVVGRRLWKIGTLAPVARELREASLPAMQDLYEATHENVQIAVRDGTKALYVERIHGKTSVPVLSRPGVPLPLHATGVGKVLLAWAPREIVEECVEDLQPITRYTITERGRMLRELAAVRRHGFARTVEEMGYGTCALAVPVLDGDAQVVAALAIVTRSLRRDIGKFVPALRVAAASITRRMAS